MIEKRIKIRIPLDTDSMLERECPHCHNLFAIDKDEFDRRVHLNLRCPSCGLIERADAYLTRAQRRYRDAVARVELNRLASAHVNKAMDEMFNGIQSSPYLRVERGGGRIDFGAEDLSSPLSGRALVLSMCEDCSFRYKAEAGVTVLCPVCR